MALPSFLTRKNKAMDLTVGHPLKKALVFMVPLLIGNLFQQMYSMVDTVIVGQTLGSNALAGVGSTGGISFLIMGFVSGLCQGFSIKTSQRRGARDEEGMRNSFATGIMLTLLIISVLTVIAVFAARPLLEAMNTLPELMPYAETYITTIFSGMLFSAFYNEFASTLRAIGDSVVPLYFLIFSSFLNAGLDAMFILVLGMGVQGAAVATLLSQGISAVLTFVYMWIRYPVLRIKLRNFNVPIKSYASHLRLGIPMALQMSVVSIGMIFGQTALNSMQNAEMNAGYVAATKIDAIACSAINSIGSAVSTFVGQNYGARRYDRIKKGMRQIILFAFALSIGLGLLVIALHRPFLRLFISDDDFNENLVSYSLTYLVFNGGFYVLLASLCSCRGALQGMGRGAVTLLSAVVEVAMRVLVALIAINLHDFNWVCACNSAAWLGANFILIPLFLTVLNKYIPLVGRSIKKVRLPNPSEIPKRCERRMSK
ncbi:MAG: MATE family efflux transporter [Clostridiales bacterium]|nr:MATE family efflux transporter [Clostridiales bacterium]